MSAIELIFGLFGALFMLVVFVAISFVISRFSIKFFEKKTLFYIFANLFKCLV